MFLTPPSWGPRRSIAIPFGTKKTRMMWRFDVIYQVCFWNILTCLLTQYNWIQNSVYSDGVTSCGVTRYGRWRWMQLGYVNFVIFDQCLAMWQTIQVRAIVTNLLWNSNKNSYALYRTVTFPMTLSDLWRPFQSCVILIFNIRYDSVYLTCSKQLTGSQLSLSHGKYNTR